MTVAGMLAGWWITGQCSGAVQGTALDNSGRLMDRPPNNCRRRLKPHTGPERKRRSSNQTRRWRWRWRSFLADECRGEQADSQANRVRCRVVQKLARTATAQEWMESFALGALRGTAGGELARAAGPTVSTGKSEDAQWRKGTPRGVMGSGPAGAARTTGKMGRSGCHAAPGDHGIRGGREEGGE